MTWHGGYSTTHERCAYPALGPGLFVQAPIPLEGMHRYCMHIPIVHTYIHETGNYVRAYRPQPTLCSLSVPDLGAEHLLALWRPLADVALVSGCKIGQGQQRVHSKPSRVLFAHRSGRGFWRRGGRSGSASARLQLSSPGPARCSDLRRGSLPRRASVCTPHIASPCVMYVCTMCMRRRCVPTLVKPDGRLHMRKIKKLGEFGSLLQKAEATPPSLSPLPLEAPGSRMSGRDGRPGSERSQNCKAGCIISARRYM